MNKEEERIVGVFGGFYNGSVQDSEEGAEWSGGDAGFRRRRVDDQAILR
jgi:hypothetical protein